MKNRTQTILACFAVLLFAVGASGCNDDGGTNLEACGEDEYRAAGGECKADTFSVQENAKYSAYRPGGVGSFTVVGLEPGELTVLVNGDEATAEITDDRLYVSVPMDAGSFVTITFVSADGEKHSLTREVEEMDLLAAEEAISSRSTESQQMLTAMESTAASLETASPENLLAAVESVGSSLTESQGLLEGEESTAAAGATETLAPIMLESAESSKSADLTKSVNHILKQNTSSCELLSQDLANIAEVLGNEAGVLATVIRPLADNPDTANAAKFATSVGWAIWTDEMLSFFTGMDDFAQTCASTSHEVSIDGTVVDTTALVTVESGVPFSIEMVRTRVFESEAANLAKTELKPVTDSVMAFAGDIIGDINVNVDALNETEYTSPVDGEDVAVTVPSGYGVSSSANVNVDTGIYSQTLTFTGDRTTAEVPISITDTAAAVAVDLTVQVTMPAQ